MTNKQEEELREQIRQLDIFGPSPSASVFVDLNELMHLITTHYQPRIDTLEKAALDYPDALSKREAIERELDHAYDFVSILQDRYNDINEQIEDYEREQAALDE